MKVSLAIATIVGILGLGGCERSDQSASADSEKTSMHCRDKYCEGDREPARNKQTETALKLNNRWFVGPKTMFSSASNSLQFEWWNHQRLVAGAKRPDDAQRAAVEGKGYDFSVEVFLQSHDGDQPTQTRHGYLMRAEAERHVVSKSQPRPGLEAWRLQSRNDNSADVWYVALDHVGTDPNGSILWCRESSGEFARCDTTFMWKPGISARVRIRAGLANDWPEIYTQIVNDLRQLKEG